MECDETVTGHNRLRRRHALTVLGLVVLAEVVPLRAQTDGAIRGQVVATADGSAIEGSILTLTSATTGSTTRALTEASGGFAFSSVTPGEYIFSVSAEGFGMRQLRFLLEPREVRTLTVSLEVARVEVSLEVAGNVATIPGTHSPSSTDADRGAAGGDAGLSANHPVRCDRHPGAGHDSRARRLRAHPRPRGRAESADQRRVVLGEHARRVLGRAESRCDRDRERDDRWISGRVRQSVRRCRSTS